MSRHIVVIGGGPAGIEAARSAAGAGACVTLVTEGPLGGRAGWDSLLPSKVWLTTAEVLGLLEEAAELGISSTGQLRADPAPVLSRIGAVAAARSAQQGEELQALGVKLITGTAAFEGPGQVVVQGKNGNGTRRLTPDATIVAAGSVPRFPPDLKPDGRRVLAPRFASQLAELPQTMLVIGGGPTGGEFVHLFNRLGVKVTWLVDAFGVLPGFPPDAGRYLAATMARRGVQVQIGQPVERIAHEQDGIVAATADGALYHAAAAFLALGRMPDLGRLALEKTGLSAGPDGIVPTGPFGETEVAGVYLVGDVAGGAMLANRATAQARIAGRHAAGAPAAPFKPETVIHAVYSEPQVARVGLLPTERQAATLRLPLDSGLKARLMPMGGGFVELSADPRNGRILGAVAVGHHAADMLAPVALALEMGASLESLAAIYGAHPTAGELVFEAARALLARIESEAGR